jgi:hypothetical protein
LCDQGGINTFFAVLFTTKKVGSLSTTGRFAKKEEEEEF